MARAALVELDSLHLLSHDLRLLDDKIFYCLETELVATCRILSGFMRSVERAQVLHA